MVEFKFHRVPARKDLIDFVNEHESVARKVDVLAEIGRNPRRWIEELSLISGHLTGIGLVGGTGMDKPPEGEPEFRKLGNGAFYYNGDKPRLRGLWKKKRLTGMAKHGLPSVEWTHYRLGDWATVGINADFQELPVETFLPERFEPISKRVIKRKGPERREVEGGRPILYFGAKTSKEKIGVYAKGSLISCGYFYDASKPSYRLTHFSQINKATSKREMERTLKLAELGVKVPEVIAYYQSPAEDFLFLKTVGGISPVRDLNFSRGEIIKQDAEMLAALCLSGLQKGGFTDFDDKIWTGEDLYLIDVDECTDLYWGMEPDYETMVINPQDRSGLRNFRRMQRGMFKTMLRDAIHEYRETLTPTTEDQQAYVASFYNRAGWKPPTASEMKKLLDFPKNYVTHERNIAMACESD